MERTSQLTIVVAVWAVIAHLVSPAPGKVIYVDDDATGANNGSSWADAFHFLQPAVQEAKAGDEIRLAQGTYKPDQGIPAQPPRHRSISVATTDEYASFHLSGVTLRGGFAGLGAGDPDARDVRGYETVLSGDLKGNDDDRRGPWHPITEFFRRDNSHYVVVCGAGDSTTVLDGLVIMAATQTGLWQQGGSLRVMDCTFTGNSGFQGSAIWSVGGAASLSHCTFTANVAEIAGGALSFEGNDLTLSDCYFLNNACRQEGGALYSRRSHVSLINCTFESNAAELGGALLHSKGTLELTGTRFEGNMAAMGGAIVVQAEEPVVMSACDFRMNRAVHLGGAVNNTGGSLILEGCVFSGNSADEGGALHGGSEDVNLANCVFAGNQADSRGGALFCGVGTIVATHCTFADNRAERGGTLAAQSSSRLPVETDAMVASNCILWDAGPSSVDSGRRNAIVTYSDVQGGWSGEGNIEADPCFAAPGAWVHPDDPSVVLDANDPDAVWIDGDYHLKSQAGRWDPKSQSWVVDDVTSPCIDAGDPNTPVADEPSPNGGRINMGAYGGTAEASKSYTHLVP